MASSKIKLDDVSSANGTQKVSLPKYSSQVINLANGYAKATRPDNVGQVSEDIKRFRDDETLSGYSNQDWINWHQNHYPNGIQKATDEAWAMFVKMRNSLNTVTKDDIRKWEEDFVYSKTYDGLMVQNAIITKIANDIGSQIFAWQHLKKKDKVLMALLTTTLCKLNQKRMIEQENFITKNYNVSLFHTLKRPKASCLIITQKISNRSKKG